MNVISPPRPPRTMLEVHQLLPEGTLCQLINNQLVMSPAQLDSHQSVLIEIASELHTFVKKNNLGLIRVASYDVYFDKNNIFQPDIVFLLKENAYKIKRNGLHGAPDLVIEILSTGTKDYDKNEKRFVYEKHGVKEYWITEPESKEVIFYLLVNDELVEIEAQKGVINSKLLDVTINF